MIEVLAQFEGPTTTNGFNPNFFGWLVVSALVVVNILVGVKNLRRVPSIDVEFTKLRGDLKVLSTTVAGLNTTVEAAKETVEEVTSHDKELGIINEKLATVSTRLTAIDHRLGEGDKQFAELSSRQAVNAQSLSDIKDDMHDTNRLITAVAAKLKVSI